MNKMILKACTIWLLTSPLNGCGLEALIEGLEQDDNLKTINENHKNKIKMSGKMAAITVDGTHAKNNVVQGDVTIEANIKGGYDIVLNGEKYSFTSDGYSQAKRSFTKTTNISGGIKTETLTLGASQPGCCEYTDMVTLISQNGANKDGLQANAIYGVKTEKMPTNTQATYAGDILFSGIHKNTRAALSELGTGKINLKADFSSNKVSGNVELKTTAFSKTDSGTKTIGGMSIDNGSINSNGFKADLTGDAAMNQYYRETTNGKLVGDFYGPNAKEAGGVMTLENTTKVGYGAFIAKQ